MLEDSYYAAAGGPPAFDPGTLSLTGWWRDYAGSPWVGTASSGDSGNNDLTEATNPPGVSSLNSHGTADYDGTNDNLTADGTQDTYLASADGSGWVLFNADTAHADASTADFSPNFLGESNGTWGVGFSSSGIHIFVFDGSNGLSEKLIACATGGWHLLRWKYHYSSGMTLSLALDGGVWQDVTSAFGSGLSGTLTGTVRSGLRYNNGTPFFDGEVADMGISDAVLTDQNFTDVLSYVNSRYGLSLS
jgi:hypothetical protein